MFFSCQLHGQEELHLLTKTALSKFLMKTGQFVSYKVALTVCLLDK